ncbi:hypothetical protein AA0228_1731 [Gluconobacter frateurii NRIC 0228]|uniref:Uncharacterized protein n=1 Tax=Gluconobacter frateurii NRIC 0228 TaxID=1307946 RepID=A0ABQ0QC00_9PROT|nr:hypothetical protein AA0228_1731 [Gluconobacter frateurii NRIC 0228]
MKQKYFPGSDIKISYGFFQYVQTLTRHNRFNRRGTITRKFFYILVFNERQRAIPLSAACIMGRILSRSDKISLHIPDIGRFELQQLEKSGLKQILRIPAPCPSLNPY